jgi:hypothetical protein
MAFSRQQLRDGVYHRIAVDELKMRVFTKAERDVSRHALLGSVGSGEDVWVFAYGSLIWNPEFHFVERRRGGVPFRRAAAGPDPRLSPRVLFLEPFRAGHARDTGPGPGAQPRRFLHRRRLPHCRAGRGKRNRNRLGP